MLSMRRSLAVSTLCVGLSVASCGAQPDAGSEFAVLSSPATTASSEAVAVTPSSTSTTTVAEQDRSLSPLSSQVVELPSALPDRVLDGLGEPVGQVPESVTLPSLGVDGAQVIPVGLEESGELEVPGADAVGWYQFGVGVGGGRGSAVLAAHIAYNGRNGVFVGLADSEIGDQVIVSQDGVDLTYVVESVTQYGKFDLPFEDLFNESGEERLVLITCGGSFNPSLRSYDDNIVLIAVPAA